MWKLLQVLRSYLSIGMENFGLVNEVIFLEEISRKNVRCFLLILFNRSFSYTIFHKPQWLKGWFFFRCIFENQHILIEKPCDQPQLYTIRINLWSVRHIPGFWGGWYFQLLDGYLKFVRMECDYTRCCIDGMTKISLICWYWESDMFLVSHHFVVIKYLDLLQDIAGFDKSDFYEAISL